MNFYLSGVNEAKYTFVASCSLNIPIQIWTWVAVQDSDFAAKAIQILHVSGQNFKIPSQ